MAGIGASTRARIEASNIVKGGALSGKEKEVDMAYCVLDDDASWRMSSIY